MILPGKEFRGSFSNAPCALFRSRGLLQGQRYKGGQARPSAFL
jgi:hypothetical protein